MFCAYHRLFLGVQENNFFIAGTIIFAFFASLYYLLGSNLLDPEFYFAKRHSVLFIVPVALFLLFLFAFQYPYCFYSFTGIRPLDEKLRLSLLTGGTFAENLYLFIVLAILNLKYLKAFFRGDARLHKYLRHFFIVTFLLNLIIGFYFVNFFLELNSIRYSYLLGTALLYYFFAVYFIYFSEIASVEEEVKEISAGDSLRGLDGDSLVNQLKNLMTEEKLYRQEGLTQRILADRLDISPQQLSALFGFHMNINYYSYINNFRIAEAKELLINQPRMKILEIALHVGFNSQSSFYNAFKTVSGISPGEFRKKGCAG